MNMYIYIFETCVKILNIWIYISSRWILSNYLCISIFMSFIIYVYVHICIWKYAYPDLKVSNFLRVEGYAFKCLRFCKFLISQTLNGHKVAFSFVFVVILMELGVVVGFFFCPSIPLKYAFLMFLQILWAHMSCSFLLQEQEHVCFVTITINKLLGY